MEALALLCLASIISISIGGFAGVYFSGTSRPPDASLRRKSTWKLFEAPWLIMCIVSIVLAQQGYARRNIESDARAWQAKFNMTLSLIDAELDYSGRLAISQLEGCNTTQDDNANQGYSIRSKDRNSAEAKKAFCIWLREALMFLRAKSSAMLSLDAVKWHGFGEHLSEALVPIVVKNPLAPPPSTSSVRQDGKRLVDALQNGRAKSFFGCEELIEGAPKNDEAPADEMIHYALRICDASNELITFAMIARDAGRNRLFPDWITLWWPVVLAIGLGFRVCRTTAEYNLDRQKEIEEERKKEEERRRLQQPSA